MERLCKKSAWIKCWLNDKRLINQKWNCVMVRIFCSQSLFASNCNSTLHNLINDSEYSDNEYFYWILLLGLKYPDMHREIIYSTATSMFKNKRKYRISYETIVCYYYVRCFVHSICFEKYCWNFDHFSFRRTFILWMIKSEKVRRENEGELLPHTAQHLQKVKAPS